MTSAITKACLPLVLATWLFSCAAGTAPQWKYDSNGKPTQYKRYPRNMAVDYFTRFRRVAYLKVTHPVEHFLSDDQRKWLGKYGQPDYTRRPFRSRQGEQVEEWIYLKKNKLVQFIGGHVAYDGEVTDMEKTMITFGYPRGCLIAQDEPAVERFTFVYRRPFDLEREVFDFANGKLIFRQTMR